MTGKVGAFSSWDTVRLRGTCPRCHREAFWVVTNEQGTDEVCFYRRAKGTRRDGSEVTATVRRPLAALDEQVALVCANHGAGEGQFTVDRAELERRTRQGKRDGRPPRWRIPR